MRPGIMARVPGLMALALVFCVHTQAQVTTDEAINTLRRLPTISQPDQRQIRQWVEGQVKALTEAAKDRTQHWSQAFTRFRDEFRRQYTNAENSAAFKAQFAAQTAEVAAETFAKTGNPPGVHATLGRILADLAEAGQAEVVPGLLAGLRAEDAAARYFAALGLEDLHSDLVADRAKLDATVAALREAGLGTSDPVVLGQFYRALSVPPQHAPVAFDAFLALFQKRLDNRRESGVVVDPAEINAFEYFQRPEILNALSAEQKQQLARAVATFLRLDAQRYATPDLDYEEIEFIERRLVPAEEILAAVVGGNAGGNVRQALSVGGYTNRANVLREVYRWVGNPEGDQPGAMNAAPWNMPAGAP